MGQDGNPCVEVIAEAETTKVGDLQDKWPGVLGRALFNSYAKEGSRTMILSFWEGAGAGK